MFLAVVYGAFLIYGLCAVFNTLKPIHSICTSFLLELQKFGASICSNSLEVFIFRRNNKAAFLLPLFSTHGLYGLPSRADNHKGTLRNRECTRKQCE